MTIDINSMISKLQQSPEQSGGDATIKNIQNHMTTNMSMMKKLLNPANPVEIAKNNYKKAKQQLITAKPLFIDAEKKLFLAENGQSMPEYTTMLINRYTTAAEGITSIATEKTNESIKNITSSIDDYRAVLIYYNKIDEFLKILEKENKKLKIQLENDLSSTETNDRNVVYEEHSREKLIDNRKIVYYLYYLVLVGYIIFGPFIKKQEYKNIIILILLIIYACFPLVVDYITAQLLNLYRYIKYIITNKLPKNVYINIKP